jgi:hypothetical protein
MSIQKFILEHARHKARHSKKWIDELALLLSRSKNTIYKKLNGEIALTLEEVRILTSEYELTLDPFFRPGEVATFDFPFLSGQFGKVDSFFEFLRNDLQKLKSLGIEKMWVSAFDLPFVRDYCFPAITAFKFFIHNRTVWKKPLKKEQKFSFSSFLKNHSVMANLKFLLSEYYQIDSVEFLNSFILDITLSQIRHTLDSEMFEEPKDALTICDKLLEYIDHLQMLAESGLKKTFDHQPTRYRGNILFFHNEIVHTNNIMYLETKRCGAVLMQFGNPHYISTTDAEVSRYTQEWFRMLKNNAQNITRESRKSRMVFFNKLRRKVNQAHLEISTLLKIHQY